MKSLKNRIKLFIYFGIIILIILGLTTYLTFQGRISDNPVSDAVVAVARPYPKLTGPKTITLNCDYHGKPVVVSEVLYTSLYDYYRTDPGKKYAYFTNQNDKFVYAYSADKTISNLVSKISIIGKENSLSSDQTLDLAACLLQSIPYDSKKADKVLSKNVSQYSIDDLIPRYPYETLFDNSGICTDKSFLGSMVFKGLGYTTALLEFDSQRHMTIGVGVPDGYGDFGTKYAVMELTGSNFLVGDIPEINAAQGLAINNFESVPNVTDGQAVTTETKTPLTKPNNIVSISTGDNYLRIIERMALKKRLEELKPQLDILKNTYVESKNILAGTESSLVAAENNYKNNPTSASYARYSSAYSQYTSAYNTAKSNVDSYNAAVNNYNNLVASYRQF